MKTINCKGKLIDLSLPRVMGILNLTPDSFYDGGKLTSEKNILLQAEKMLIEGATFLDLGGYSSRPGAEFVSEKEELSRVLPVVSLILNEFPDANLSIDTFRSSIAKKCVEAGAAMINDISGGNIDSNMMEIVNKLKVPFCMMHMRGTPETMMQGIEYKNILKELLFYFSEKIAIAKAIGINDIIVDPGFGFSKLTQQNFELLSGLELFNNLEAPILVGVSRKSMIFKSLHISANEALNGTTVLHSIALYKGASILRVHDVKEAMECVNLLQNLN